jgi:hypothetical protein
MRTTIELPDRLLREAKTLSAAQGRTLKEFFTAALERAVEDVARVESRRMIRPPIRGGGDHPIPERSNEELAALLEAEDLAESE